MKIWIEERRIGKPTIGSEIGIEDWIEAQQFKRLSNELQLKYQLTDMALEIGLEYPMRFTAEKMEMWTIFKIPLSENESIRHFETREFKIRLEGHGLEEWGQIREQT